jgi:CheY-like chemotaxis protein
VEETEKMLRRLIGEDIALVTRLAPDAHRANVDPGQLSQVLMNLAVNARDAMPRGGRLDVETCNVTFDEDAARARGAPRAGDYLKISLRDTGYGMTPEVKERVFQPFFTTKEVGKGTGLGLAVVHGIVGQSGGFVTLESRPGKGAQFDIYLPAATPSEPQAEAPLSMRPPGARGRILLVEDDDAVRRVALRVLSAMGCTVLVANDGAEALGLLEDGRIEVDAVLTDVVMPGIDGYEMVERIRTRRPGLKTLYMSGYTDDMLVRRGVLTHEVNFLAKPYTPTSLRAAVQRLLAA